MAQNIQRKLPKPPSGMEYYEEGGRLKLRRITKPEKLTAIQAAARRLDLLGTPEEEYPPGSVRARADSVTAKIPLASEVRAEKKKGQRQARLDKQRRLKELRTAIRAALVLRNKKVKVEFGEDEALYPPGSEDRKELDAQITAMKRERDFLLGKVQYAEPLGSTMLKEIRTGDGTQGRPYEIQDSQEQLGALPSGAWFRLPGDPPGKARQKPQ